MRDNNDDYEADDEEVGDIVAYIAWALVVVGGFVYAVVNMYPWAQQ